MNKQTHAILTHAILEVNRTRPEMKCIRWLNAQLLMARLVPESRKPAKRTDWK